MNTISDGKLRSLAARIRLNGILWILIGALQLLTGVFGVVGILNIISGFRSLRKAKRLLTHRVGIVAAYSPIAVPLIVLAYNLFFGGIVGIVGSIFYFVAIRGFVMKNKAYFKALR